MTDFEMHDWARRKVLRQAAQCFGATPADATTPCHTLQLTLTELVAVVAALSERNNTLARRKPADPALAEATASAMLKAYMLQQATLKSAGLL